MAAQYFTFGVPLTADQLGQPGGPALLDATGALDESQLTPALAAASSSAATAYLGPLDDAAALSSGGLPLSAGAIWNGSARAAGAYFVVTVGGTTAAGLDDIFPGTALAVGARVLSAGTGWKYDDALRYVSSRDLFDGAVTASKIEAGAVGTAALTDDAITTAKIADNATTTAKIADNAITSAKIAAGAVATADLADGAVTAAKIAAGAVGLPALVTANVSDYVHAPYFNSLLNATVVTVGGTGSISALTLNTTTFNPPNIYYLLQRTGGTAGVSSILYVCQYVVPANATAWVDIRWSVYPTVVSGPTALSGVAGSTQGLAAGNTRVIRLGGTPANPGASTVLATLSDGLYLGAANAWGEVVLNMSGVTAVPGDVLMLQTILYAQRISANTTIALRHVKFTTTRAGAY